MHPPLFRPHPLCGDCVQELVKCHENHPMTKFFGACNDAKTNLDNCFRAEKILKRDANLAKAKSDKAAWEEKKNRTKNE